MNFKTPRTSYNVGQELIVNGLIVILNKKDKIYFESVDDFQIFYKFWIEDASKSIDECLKLMKAEKLKRISLD